MQLADDLGADAVRYQGNWIPHALRPATEDGVFFAGDSAGHCLPLTAEGIRTALYFGLASGASCARVIAGEQTREQALARYDAFSAAHAAVRVDAARPATGPAHRAAAAGAALRAMGAKRFVDWSFGHYLGIAHPIVRRGGGRLPARSAAAAWRGAGGWTATAVSVASRALESARGGKLAASGSTRACSYWQSRPR